jgi:hypothetical protein
VAKALAFYLPQYHPIPENDEWWGKGFTEWTNVARARPLFPGHYQPHLPGELGYYDLRVPEVREAQAELARAHGIGGFVYYHYWFQGRRLLHRPFDEVLASGAPDFPFALCWANEEWTRNWDGRSGRVLIRQEYSAADDRDHIRWLCTAFADPRYITIDGRPLMLVYRPGVIPDPKKMTDTWRTEAQKMGFPDLYLCWVEGWGRPPGGPGAHGFDATVGFMPFTGERVFTAAEDIRPHRILDYVSAYETRMDEPPHPWKHFPSVMVGWDNTPRYARSATIFDGATPERYAEWLGRTVAALSGVRDEENYLFLLAWNEWAEGNHLEPDVRFGRAFLEATRSVLIGGVAPGPRGGRGGKGGESLDEEVPDLAARVVSATAALMARHPGDPADVIVTIRTGADADHEARLRQAVTARAAGEPPAAGRITVASMEASLLAECGVDGMHRRLEEFGEIGAFVFVDGVDSLAQPVELLQALSTWSLAHGGVPLFLSAPNVTHLDRGVRLLLGEWGPSSGGSPLGPPRHQFTDASLGSLLSAGGWEQTDEADVRALRSSQYDAELYEALPTEMVGALRVLSETYNANGTVECFVRMLTPVSPGGSGGRSSPLGRTLTMRQRATIEIYLASIGLVTGEENRRATAAATAGGRRSRPRWLRALRRTLGGAR